MTYRKGWLPTKNSVCTYSEEFKYFKARYYLVVSTHLKNVSQIGSFPQVGVKNKKIYLKLPPRLVPSPQFLNILKSQTFFPCRSPDPVTSSILGILCRYFPFLLLSSMTNQGFEKNIKTPFSSARILIASGVLSVPVDRQGTNKRTALWRTLQRSQILGSF